MPEDELAVRPGEVIGARYRVEKVLAKSAMSLVVSARDKDLGERVALKILLPQSVANSEARARFGREARAAVKIKGRHMARVTDVGALSDGSPYMVMEYLEGEDVASRLARDGKLPEQEAIVYALQVCDVLREAHRLGILHRELEPTNLFVAQQSGRAPILKVLNFGISNVDQRDKTQIKEIIGAPWYLAPEQMKSASKVDARSDIWALGAILYELVTAKRAFEGETMPEVVMKVLHDAPSLRDAPQMLGRVIRRCLSKAPAERYPNVDELASALTAIHGRSDASDASTLIVDERDAEIVDDDDDAANVDDVELLPPSSPLPAIRSAQAAPADEAARSRLPLVAALLLAPVAVLVGMRLLGREGAEPMHAIPRAPPAPVSAGPVLPEPSQQPAAVAPSASASESASAAPSASAISAPLEVVVATAAPHVMRQVVPAAGSALPEPKAAPPSPDALRDTRRGEKDDDATVALQVAMRNHGALRTTCWESSERTTYVVTVNASVDPSGAVSAANAASADPKLAECVASQVRTWSFPPSTSARTLQFPVRFRR